MGFSISRNALWRRAEGAWQRFARATAKGKAANAKCAQAEEGKPNVPGRGEMLLPIPARGRQRKQSPGLFYAATEGGLTPPSRSRGL